MESRGWRRGAPQSPSPSSFGAPQGNNEIYKCDTVFPIGETNTNNQRTTPIPYKITKDISRTQFDRQTASQIGKGNQQTASQSTCPQVRASRAARYWMPRHPRTCRAITELVRQTDCKSKNIGRGISPTNAPASEISTAPAGGCPRESARSGGSAAIPAPG